ncbi:MAG: glycosyltransferase [Bacteroidetes bacterium]|nr:glycosyltransferase [Bacteroidota bacterium]
MADSTDYKIHFFFGNLVKKSIKEIDFKSELFKNCQVSYTRLTNYRINKILFWQKGVIRRCFLNEYDIALFLGDMYILSTWIGAFIARIKGKKVFFWSHGLYNNENSIKKAIRIQFFKIAHHHFLYNERGKKLLAQEGFESKNLSVIYNSLEYDEHKLRREGAINPVFYHQYFSNPNLPILLFVGRLTTEKKLNLLLDAAKHLNQETTTKVNVMIVGDGPTQQSLQSQSSTIQENIYFFGECYQEELLSKLIANADLCVSPGNVGLTAIHSLSYGTPVCTHSDMNCQMPEAETVVEGKTGTLFLKDNSKNLAEKIKQWIHSRRNREEIRKNCYAIIDEFYNPHYQMKVFNSVFNS